MLGGETGDGEPSRMMKMQDVILNAMAKKSGQIDAAGGAARIGAPLWTPE